MIEDFDRDLFKKCMPRFEAYPVIFDIGAHEGLYTKFVLDEIPRAECYLFEPNTELFKHLAKYKNAFPIAVSDMAGGKSFYVCPKQNDELSSLYKREVFAQTTCKEEQVTCVTVDSFCRDNFIEYIDYMKVDVEGAELDVLKGSLGMMSNKKIRFIQIEYGGTYKDAGIKLIDVILLANSFGYSIYKLVEGSLLPVTEETIIEDYQYGVYLLTHLPC